MSVTPRLLDFPDAPRGAWVSDEGWLVLGNEAWTLQEWLAQPSHRPRSIAIRTVHATAEERREAHRLSRWRWNQRKRADPAYREHERQLTLRRKATA